MIETNLIIFTSLPYQVILALLINSVRARERSLKENLFANFPFLLSGNVDNVFKYLNILNKNANFSDDLLL